MEQSADEQSLELPSIHVSLTSSSLDATIALSRVKSPKAGAVVLFAGTLLPFSPYTTPSLTQFTVYIDP